MIFVGLVGSNGIATRLLSITDAVVSGDIKVFGIVIGTVANGRPLISFSLAAPYPPKLKRFVVLVGAEIGAMAVVLAAFEVGANVCNGLVFNVKRFAI